MPTEDGIKFIYKDFMQKTKGIHTYRSHQHPEAVQTLLKNLYENRSLTVLQYDHILKYLSQRREVQVKAEIGEDAHEPEKKKEPTPPPEERRGFAIPFSAEYQAEKGLSLQKKIVNLLKNKSISEKIAQGVDRKTRYAQMDRDHAKQKVLKDEKVKTALNALLGRKN